MSKKRSLPRFCIALSAAVLLTGGLASANDDNMPTHWGEHSSLHSGFFAELNDLAAPFKALAEHIRQEQEREAREAAERQRKREQAAWLARIGWEEKRQREQGCFNTPWTC
ncbi:MAG: hypothetical protein GDA41_11685 [Rhodospirillales bacterium]|nr:hypothetical protein [Rhodospirillales bacterium]